MSTKVVDCTRTEWNKRIRDSVDSLLEQAGFAPDSSARHQLACMNFDDTKSRKTDALIDYVLQDDEHNRLTPRVIDIAFSAFMVAKSGKNKDDGGAFDWFNDTRPMVLQQLEKIRKDLANDRGTV